MSSKHIPSLILGGSGYVAAETLRLLIDHPAFRVDAVVSQTLAGQRVDSVFPHLTGSIGNLTFSSMEMAEDLMSGKRKCAVFAAMPHGETAPVLAGLIADSGGNLAIVDMSADFRLRSAAEFERVYKKPHPHPELIPEFTFALPDLDASVPTSHVSHPGCFTTCVTLACAPLLALGFVGPKVRVSAVTGSTGAGKSPRQGTHHPERQSAMWAYEPLRHRHRPEMELLTNRYGTPTSISFVPHSGPFSRGIHATLFFDLKLERPLSQIVESVADFYRNCAFVSVSTKLPSLKEVVASNRCHIGIAREGDDLVVTSVIDNLVKGAAGGSVQWMNRIFGLDDTTGLMSPVAGWI